MKRIPVYVDESQIEQLKAISDETGAPVAELIRRAISAYLETRKPTPGGKVHAKEK